VLIKRICIFVTARELLSLLFRVIILIELLGF
jgi:hypothetical protein